jgi:predicted lysophospholipase L1 biosynthesis ABC-type transport system permease subunit
VTAVVLSLGLGLTVLATVGQIDANLRNAISADLPDRAPSYFFIDIQPDQLEGFLARWRAIRGVSDIDTAPQLRGVITAINDRPRANRQPLGPARRPGPDLFGDAALGHPTLVSRATGGPRITTASR